MIKRIVILLAAAALLVMPLATAEVRVALSMGHTDTARDIAVARSILSQLDGDSFSVHLVSADGSLSRQISDIKGLVEDKPDYLLVSAVRSIGLGSAIAEARQEGVSVILVDHFSTDAAPEDVLTSIGVDWGWAGAACADILGDCFKDAQASLLEVQGASIFSATQEASKGFRAALREHEGLQLAGVLAGGSDRQTASQALLNFIEEKGFCFDAVFAHGDEQALGVINALLSASADEDIPIVCIGGGDDARRAMTAGKLFACVQIADAPGAEVADAIARDMAGENVEPVRLSRGSVQYAMEGR